MGRNIFLSMFVLFVGLAACSTNRQVVHKDRYIISSEEIAMVPGAQNAYEIVRMLRPSLLERDKARYSGLTPPLDALVYVNNSRVGPKKKLLGIANMGIMQIKYVDGIEATTRYGTDASGGIFFVLIKHNMDFEAER
jgi:hypothetical protein